MRSAGHGLRHGPDPWAVCELRGPPGDGRRQGPHAAQGVQRRGEKVRREIDLPQVRVRDLLPDHGHRRTDLPRQAQCGGVQGPEGQQCLRGRYAELLRCVRRNDVSHRDHNHHGDQHDSATNNDDHDGRDQHNGANVCPNWWELHDEHAVLFALLLLGLLLLTPRPSVLTY